MCACHLLASGPSLSYFCAFGLQERTFKSEPMVEQLMVHYSTDGFLLHRSNEEARRQLEAEKAADDAANRFQAEVGAEADADGPERLATPHWRRCTAAPHAASGRQIAAPAQCLLPRTAAEALPLHLQRLEGRNKAHVVGRS